jgi:phosphatidylglycerophosphate synthase
MGEGSEDETVVANRRPLKSRGTGWARAAARLLLRTRISADQVSLLGILVSVGGAAAYLGAPQRPWLLLVAALAVQLRLLCNLLDGLVAVEGGRKSPYGPLFNEAPDRLEDSLFLVAAGYAAGQLWLGLLAALLACLTAYVRTLGGSLGFPQDFSGPMAKPHRMAALTLGSLAAFAEALWRGTDHALTAALWLIVAGAALTALRRTWRIAAQLEAAA